MESSSGKRFAKNVATSEAEEEEEEENVVADVVEMVVALAEGAFGAAGSCVATDGANGTGGGARLLADETLRFLCELPYEGGGVAAERAGRCDKVVVFVFVVLLDDESLEGLDNRGCWILALASAAEDEKEAVSSSADCGSSNTAGSSAQAFTNLANGLPRMASSVAPRQALMLRRSRRRESCDFSEGSTRDARGGAVTAGAAAEEEDSREAVGRGSEEWEEEKVMEGAFDDGP